MSSNFIELDNAKNKFSQKATFEEPILELNLRFDGYNEDISEAYFWHMNFAYYTGKGYGAIKLEDQHYFSEASQYGMNIRQIKGNSIRAFQENFQQLITLIRQHLIPLLKEVKEAHLYKTWFDKITINDDLVQKELEKSSPSQELLKKYRAERNEAINHMKDKWVNEVDQGRIWQMNRSSTEQGLDFALLPQLFFGISLDDPFYKKKTLKEQLDSDVYPVDISLTAKEQVARFMYKFHTWLPTAVKDTQVTFKLKISALKNIYAQTQMYINFMKPLLKEISSKTEGLEANNIFKGFEENHPDFVNLLDTSYTYVKILGVREFLSPRGKYKIQDLEFSRFGFWINDEEILHGKYKKKKGFLGTQDSTTGDIRYQFFPSDNKNPSDLEFQKMKDDWIKSPKYVYKKEMKIYPVMEKDFIQRRRNDIKQTQQGPQPVPNMRNNILYKARVWNIYEIASYREKLKEDNMRIMESFIDELAIVREDLLKYVNYFDGVENESLTPNTNNETTKVKKKNSSDYTLLFGPFQAIGQLFSPLVPNFSSISLNKQTSKGLDKRETDSIEKLKIETRLKVIEDTWKVYSIFKKAHGFIQY